MALRFTRLFRSLAAIALIFGVAAAQDARQIELRCFVTEALLGTNVKSDLRFAILKRLREAGIEIPYPQSDLTLRDWPRIEREIRGLAGGNTDGAAADGEGEKRPS